ncbi:HAD-like domain-containing protein [Linnemannia elongata]|nr:HAD-like domain-containing protein [Linnemannia elongata]
MSNSSVRPTSVGPYKAVLFDIGGVVVGSPFQGIADFEVQHNLPVNYLNVAITRAGHNGAFQRLERGEVDLWSFYDAFSDQLSDPRNVAAYAKYAELRSKDFDEKSFKAPKVDGRALFHQMMSKAAVVNPCMVEAIAALRKAGYTVAALTNNFNYPSDERGQQEQDLILKETADSFLITATTTTGTKGSGAIVMGQDQLKTLFDHFIESAILGLRKPDPAIYKKAAEIVGFKSEEIVFLDDIGANLKAAQNEGWTTIRVLLGKPRQAIEQLESTLGITLLAPESRL